MRKIVLAMLGVVVLGAAAVATAVQLGAAPKPSDCAGGTPAAPPAAVYRLKAGDGNCLQGYVWAPQAGAPRAALVVVHGLHDHARRYQGLGQAAVEAGFAVIAQDHRGHGGSGGAPQRLDSVEQLLGDVELAIAEARRRFPGVPVVVHGHSMGGMVVAQLAARRGSGLAGAVISSAALKLPVSASEGQVRVVSAIAAIAPNLGLEAVDEAQIVRGSAERAALAADPLISRQKLPARTLATLLGGVLDLQPRLAAIEAPLLILHGGADQVTDPTGSRLLHERARSTAKTLRIHDAALHDLLHEPEGTAVTREIVAFVEERVKR